MTLVFLLGSNLNIFSEDQGSPRCSSWYLAISFWWNLPSGLLCLCLASVYILSLRWPKHWAFFGQEVINQAFMVDRHHKTPDILLHGKGRVSLSDTLFCFFSSHYQICFLHVLSCCPMHMNARGDILAVLCGLLALLYFLLAWKTRRSHKITYLGESEATMRTAPSQEGA